MMFRYARLARRAFLMHDGRRGTPKPGHMATRWEQAGWMCATSSCRDDDFGGTAYRGFIEGCRAARGLYHPGKKETWYGDWKPWGALTDRQRRRWQHVAFVVYNLWNMEGKSTGICDACLRKRDDVAKAYTGEPLSPFIICDPCWASPGAALTLARNNKRAREKGS